MRHPGGLLGDLALGVLLVLLGSAALAPLLASDLPLYIDAADRGAYERARRELNLPVRGLIRLLEAAPSGGPPAGSQGGSQADQLQARLRSEREAASLRIATMRTYLEPGAATLLVRLADELDRALELHEEGDRSAALSTAHGALSTARLAESSLVARLGPDAADTPEPGGAGVQPHPRSVPLRAVASYPLPASLSWLDAFGALLFVGVLVTLPVWRRLLRRPAGPAPSFAGARRTLGWMLGAAALGALLFTALGPRAAPRDWKAAWTAGELDVVRVVCPPLFYGYDESHLGEVLQPPSWAQRGVDADPESPERRGARAAPEPRAGEPPLSSPWRHPLGTDGLGRDLLTRILWGGRVSLSVGLLSAALLLAIGVVAGATAGYLGGWVDRAVSRLIELVQCFPAFFLIVTVVALIGEQRLHPLAAVVGVIALVNWTSIARLVRAEFLRARELDYVAAARAQGLAPARIAFGHVLPNVLGPVVVAAAFAVASGLLIESGVSFLGFGVRLPVPSWGALLSESRSLEHWWLQLFAGLVIFVTVLSIHVLGEALRAAHDPVGASLATRRDGRVR